MPTPDQLRLDDAWFPVSDASALSTLGRRTPPRSAYRVREALKPYLDLPRLRALAASGGNLLDAVRTDDTAPVPAEVYDLLSLYAALLRPEQREQIAAPADLAALLMTQMGLLEQEELWLVSLNTKNYVVGIDVVYRGTIDSSTIRIADIFKTALRRNAASIIISHNHPSTDPTPSPEDVAVTRQIADAGKLLGCDLLDHLVIGHGRWVSLRERRLGFSS